MNNIVFFIGRPGFGKTTLSSLYCKKSDDGFVFHMGHLLKKPEDFKKFITIEEISYIKHMRSIIDDSISCGKLCKFDRIDAIATKTIIGLASQYTVYLDGYPRNVVQANMLHTECRMANIVLAGIYIKYNIDDSLQDMLSFHRQYQRDLKEMKKDPFDSISRYNEKIATFNTETLSVVHYLEIAGIPIRTIYIGHNDAINDTKQIPFTHIVDQITGKKFYGNEFYFYPVSVAEYASFYANYSIHKFPIMVTITLSNKCTDNCVGCFNAGHDSKDYIDINVLENLVDELANNGTVAIKVAGREPTAYPFLGRFLKRCRERHIMCVIITSGANLDIWESDLYEYCDHLRVSLNAYYEKSHIRYHRPSDEAIPFHKRLEVLNRISLERNKHGLTTGVSFLIRDNNENELQLLIRYCKKIGVDYLRFSEINYFNKKQCSRDEFISNMEAQSTNSFSVRYHKQYVSDCEMVKNPEFSCPALLSRCVILANGDVVSCHGSTHLSQCGYNSVYGNINISSFKSIWCGETRRAFIQNISNALFNNYQQQQEYVCTESRYCASCKYSGFNHINRWIANQGSNIFESYWSGILYDEL